MSKDFEDYLQKQLEDSEFHKEYDAMQPEFAIIRALIDAREKYGLTKQDISDRTGITRRYISKLENGKANPSVHTLQRLADGMGMTLKIEFVPKQY